MRTIKPYTKKGRPFIMRYVLNARLMRPYVHPLSPNDTCERAPTVDAVAGVSRSSSRNSFGGLKIPRSRYVPVKRNLTAFCVFCVSKNQ